MPAKGSKFVYANRDYIFNKLFFKNVLVDQKKITFSFAVCKDIIESANKEIAQIVTNDPEGFKLSFGLGYLVSCKFKPKNAAIDWVSTKRIGKKVYFLNLNTLGWSCRVNWFRIRRIQNAYLYGILKFEPYKTLSSSVAKAFREGAQYQPWTRDDFVIKGKLENLYSKKFRKELKE